MSDTNSTTNISTVDFLAPSIASDEVTMKAKETKKTGGQDDKNKVEDALAGCLQCHAFV